MRRFHLVLSVVLCAGCSKSAENGPAPVAQASPSAAAQGSTPAATAPASSVSPVSPAVPPPPAVIPLSGPRVSQIVVHYDSTSPDAAIVNGNRIDLADIDRKFPGEFQRLEALATGKPPFPYETLRIEVDAATPYSLVRRLHDALEKSGARQAQLIVEGFKPPSGAGLESHPLNLEFPAADRDRGPLAGATEVVEVRLKSTADGRTESAQLGRYGAVYSQDARSTIAEAVERRAMIAASAAQDPPKFAVLADERLRADELAAMLFACQYRLDEQSGKHSRRLKQISIAPFAEAPEKELTQKLERAIEPSTNLVPASSVPRMNTRVVEPTATGRGRLFGTPFE